MPIHMCATLAPGPGPQTTERQAHKHKLLKTVQEAVDKKNKSLCAHRFDVPLQQKV